MPKSYWDLRNVNPSAAQESLGGKGFVPKKIDGAWFICKKSDEHVENPDIADTYNTVLKMAKKRAFVDTVITGTAASDCVNQDLEDLEEFAAKMRQPSSDMQELPTPVAPKRAVQQQPTPGGASPFPPPRKPTAAQQSLSLGPKQALWDAIKDYANGDNKAAGAICKELTGVAFYTRVPDDVAVRALAQFREDYLAQEPVGNADVIIDDNDIPF